MDFSHPSRRGFLALAAFTSLGASALAAGHFTLAHGAEVTWNSEGWRFISSLSDDFDSSESATRWVTGLWYPGFGTVQKFHDENAIFDHENSLLRLRASVGQESTDGARYRFSAVESRFDIPGVASYTEVRAKMLDTRANVPPPSGSSPRTTTT